MERRGFLYVVEDEPIDDDDSSLEAATETDARVVHVAEEEDALESRDEPRRAAAPIQPRRARPRRLPCDLPIGESRFKSHDAYVSRTTLGAIDASELDDPSDEDEYPFRRETAGRRPALNTPAPRAAANELSASATPRWTRTRTMASAARTRTARATTTTTTFCTNSGTMSAKRRTARVASQRCEAEREPPGRNTSDSGARGDIVDRL